MLTDCIEQTHFLQRRIRVCVVAASTNGVDLTGKKVDERFENRRSCVLRVTVADSRECDPIASLLLDG
jgi:hypothetical protein